MTAERNARIVELHRGGDSLRLGDRTVATLDRRHFEVLRPEWPTSSCSPDASVKTRCPCTGATPRLHR